MLVCVLEETVFPKGLFQGIIVLIHPGSGLGSHQDQETTPVFTNLVVYERISDKLSGYPNNQK